MSDIFDHELDAYEDCWNRGEIPKYPKTRTKSSNNSSGYSRSERYVAPYEPHRYDVMILCGPLISETSKSALVDVYPTDYLALLEEAVPGDEISSKRIWIPKKILRTELSSVLGILQIAWVHEKTFMKIYKGANYATEKC